MAKADLRLDVETKYNGDGLNKLKQGVKEADTQIKKASQSLNQIQGALGGVSNEAGKAAGAISGLMQSFAQGGIWGMAAAGAMMVVNLIVDGFKKAKEEAKAAAEAAKNAFIDSARQIGESLSKNLAKLGQATRIRKTQDADAEADAEAELELKIQTVRNNHTKARKNMTSDDELRDDREEEQLEIEKLKRDRVRDKAVADFKSSTKDMDETREAWTAAKTAVSKAGDKLFQATMKVKAARDEIEKLKKEMDAIEPDPHSDDPLATFAAQVAIKQRQIDNKEAEYKDAVKMQRVAFDEKEKLESISKDKYAAYESAQAQHDIKEKKSKAVILAAETTDSELRQKMAKDKADREKAVEKKYEAMTDDDRHRAIQDQDRRLTKESNADDIKSRKAELETVVEGLKKQYEEKLNAKDLAAAEKVKAEMLFQKAELDYVKSVEKANAEYLEQERKKAEQQKKHIQDQKTSLERQKKAIEDQAKNDEDNRKAAENIKNLREEQAKLIKENNLLIAAGGGQNGWNGGGRGGTWGDYLHAKRGQDRTGSKQMNRDINNVIRGGQAAADIIASDMTDEQRAKYQNQLAKLGDPKKSESPFFTRQREALQKLLGADKNAQLKKAEKDAEEQKRKQNEDKRTEYLKIIAEKIQDLGVV